MSWKTALALPVALLLFGSVIASVQARPAHEGRRGEEALGRRTAAHEQRAAARERRATERAENAAARSERAAARKAQLEARRAGGLYRSGGAPGWERENAVVLSSCTVINWTFRRFPNLSHNTLVRRIKVGHFAHVFQTLDFDGSGAQTTTAINAPPGNARVDTFAKWKTNGVKGHFDIVSKKTCPPAPALTIEKLQRIAGSGEGFTTTPLTGQSGQIVEYEMIVRNTGNVPLVVTSFSDPRCDPGTIMGGQGETPLQPGAMPSLGESTTYTCKHEITSANMYENTASVTASPPPGAGPPIEHTSNTVVVSGPAPPAPHVFVGYADSAENDHGTSSGVPNPWKGSEGVTFVGCGYGGVDSCPMHNNTDLYDGGAIRIDAGSGAGTMSVTGAKVVVGPCTYEPWPGLNVAIAPERTLILTQTGKHKCTPNAANEQDNLDTSESFLKSPQYQEFLKTGTCSNDGYIPEITLTINGTTTTLKDTGQTLNTGGIDPDICHHASETANWLPLQVGGARVGGSMIIEPSAGALRHRAHSRRSKRAHRHR